MKHFRLYELKSPKTGRMDPVGLITTPDSVKAAMVTAAWSYALKYAPKVHGHLDYLIAVKTISKRHPSWQYVPFADVEAWTGPAVLYQAGLADKDKLD